MTGTGIVSCAVSEESSSCEEMRIIQCLVDFLERDMENRVGEGVQQRGKECNDHVNLSTCKLLVAATKENQTYKRLIDRPATPQNSHQNAPTPPG